MIASRWCGGIVVMVTVIDNADRGSAADIES